MVTLDAMFPAVQKKRLLKAAESRYACRAFAGALSTGDWAAMSYVAQRYALPGARLMLLHVPESLFTGTLLNMGRVSGCTAVAAVIVDSAVAQSRIHAGVLGEALCLEATAQGLGSCWISGTYRKKQLTTPLRDGEAALAVIALGKPARRVQASRKRKPVEKFCRGNMMLWPAALRKVAEAVRLAPSAMNLQPVTMTLEQGRFTFDAPDRAALDLGIALCHGELAMDFPHAWHFAGTRKEPAAWVTQA